MSDTLLVEANNMKAKDERFISQGIYNMLYGTVELLIVSAEASRVTGDSDTLSANRSKVGVYINSRWHNGCTFLPDICILGPLYTEKRFFFSSLRANIPLSKPSFTKRLYEKYVPVGPPGFVHVLFSPVVPGKRRKKKT